MRGLAALLVVAALGGCATGVPVEQQVVVAGGRFANVQGEARLTVRSFVEAADGRREVLGARCRVVTSLYEAELTTPARLVVPNFGPQSPELAFDCTAGELAGSARRDIVTTWQSAPGAYGPPFPYGGFGAVYGMGWPGYGWGRGPSFPVSRYPGVAVMLR